MAMVLILIFTIKTITKPFFYIEEDTNYPSESILYFIFLLFYSSQETNEIWLDQPLVEIKRLQFSTKDTNLNTEYLNSIIWYIDNKYVSNYKSVHVLSEDWCLCSFKDYLAQVHITYLEHVQVFITYLD